MIYFEYLTKLSDDFLTRAENALKAKQKHTVWWRNPDKQDQWDIYQSGLSKTKADELVKKITYFLSVRWFNRNIPTRVLPDGHSF